MQNDGTKLFGTGHELLADENVEERSQDFDDDYGSQSFSQRSDQETDLTPAQKIDLWKKLQDLMRNQLREERQVVKAKELKLTSQHKKFYKIHLPKVELDKFNPSKGLRDFFVHIVFSSKYYERNTQAQKKTEKQIY